MKAIATLLAFGAVLAGLLTGWCTADAGRTEGVSERQGTTTVEHVGVRS